MSAVLLQEKHLEGAKLLPTRDYILPHMPKGGLVAEVGVALGDYSRKILNIMEPKHFWAIDLFDLHHASQIWGRDCKEVFQDKTHEQFYQNMFATEMQKDQLSTLKGFSQEAATQLEDGVLDMVYIDAGHDYESVRQDIQAYKSKLKPDGFLVMNDYIMADHVMMELYGVVQATNEFCLSEGWKIAYFALQEDMFCDVALQRL